MNLSAMEIYRRRMRCQIFAATTLLLLIFNGGMLLIIRGLAGSWQGWTLPDWQPAAVSIHVLEGLYWQYMMPISVAVLVIAGFGLGFLLERSLLGLQTSLPTPPAPLRRPAAAPGMAQPDSAPPQHRLYLHLLSALQQDGRLLDFLYEDLADYDDAQVGAAVRNIHENCRRVVDRYVAPEAVVAEEEGATMVIPSGFDATQFKLTGAVKGPPPFTGVVQHRGWRMGKKELPVLLAETDAKIIMPAEIEIQST